MTAPVPVKRRNLHPCPYCGEPITGGLLAVCPKRECVEADTADTRRMERDCG